MKWSEQSKFWDKINLFHIYMNKNINLLGAFPLELDRKIFLGIIQNDRLN